MNKLYNKLDARILSKAVQSNGMHNAIEPCDRIRRSENSRREDAAANATILIQNVPTKFIREVALTISEPGTYSDLASSSRSDKL